MLYHISGHLHSREKSKIKLNKVPNRRDRLYCTVHVRRQDRGGEGNSVFESRGDSVCRCESRGLNGYLSLLMGNRLPDHGQMDRNAQNDQREAKNQTYCILSQVIRRYRKKKT